MSRGQPDRRRTGSTSTPARAAKPAGRLAVTVLAVLLGTAGTTPVWAAPAVGRPAGMPGALDPTPGVEQVPDGRDRPTPQLVPQATPATQAATDPARSPAPSGDASAGTRATTAPADPSGLTGRLRPAGLGVEIVATDLLLAPDYWTNGGAVAELAMTVINTGRVSERVSLTYTLPGGLRDTGDEDCAAVDNTFRCPPRRLEAGGSSTFRTRLRITGDAWRRMPMAGTATATAIPTGDGTGTATAQRAFAVLFPAGPPTAGMALSAGEVGLVTGSRVRGSLNVRLGNTGTTPAAGSVEAVLPVGFRVTTVPDGCRSAGAQRLRCDLGTLPAGGAGSIRLPVSARSSAVSQAPLAGVVFGSLDPVEGPTRKMQASYRVVLTGAQAVSAPLSTAGPAATTAARRVSAPVAAAPERGWAQRLDPLTVVLAVIGVCVLALALATVSLRRRLRDDPGIGQPDDRRPPR